MENSIYNAMIAANQILEKQTTIANNLANISTTGFKEQFNYFLTDHENNLVNKFNYIKKYYNFSPGTLSYTNRNLDLFVKENGWLCVKDLNGQEAYTKNGHLKINSQSKLTIQENEVLGNNGSITIPKHVDIKILSNGAIVAINKNKKTNFQQVIGNLKLVSIPPNYFIQKENGLFYFNKTNGILNKYRNLLNHDKNLRVQPGLLEASNVNTAKNMIEMISNARQFETQMKMISMCDKNAEYANQLININN